MMINEKKTKKRHVLKLKIENKFRLPIASYFETKLS